MLNISVRKKYFDAIRCGKKTVEGRLNTDKFACLKPGMLIDFTVTDSPRTAVCMVEAVTVYPDFKALLLAEGLSNVLPDVKSVEEGVKVYEGFPDYKKSVKRMGALAIKMRLCTYKELVAASKAQE